MNGYNPGYGTGYNQNNYGNYGMMQSQIPTQSIAQTSLQGMQTGQGYNSTLLTHKMASECFLWAHTMKQKQYPRTFPVICLF